MHVTALHAAGFRNLAHGPIGFDPGITLLWGPNGAGKSNVLEALCLALGGHSPRTRREREAIAFGEDVARCEVEVAEEGGTTRYLWSLSRFGERRRQAGGHPIGERERVRPPLAYFHPDRLDLVKGPPATRRGYLDRASDLRWPARAAVRRAYAQALAQRNALLARVRAGAAHEEALDTWDRRLAEAGVELIECRSQTLAALSGPFAQAAIELGLPEPVEVAYRPRTEATEPEGLEAELRERRSTDTERGYTAHGPHLDDVAIAAAGRPLRRYGSQGQQRLAVVALLLAERSLAAERPAPVALMLLDDLMSELDPDRRESLASRLAAGGGQAIVTATEPDHLPASCPRLEVELGAPDERVAPAARIAA